MIGAYRSTTAFAYPGWRLTVPGGPAGGHYKGFTHTQAAGTDIPPGDQYEQDREDGMSSHDAVHASLRNPRGVYRSSGEVPPRPNASGSAHTYRSFQTQRHPGTSVSPGSFPADFFVTDEDAFLSRFDPALSGMGLTLPRMSAGAEADFIRAPIYSLPHPIVDSGSVGPITSGVFQYPVPQPMPAPAQTWVPMPPVPAPPVHTLPIQVEAPPVSRPNVCTNPSAPPAGQHWEVSGVDSYGCTFYHMVPDAQPVAPPTSGATSVVTQPPAQPLPAPPSPSVPVYVAPPISPTPAPTVATNQVIPLNDGSGNYLNLSTGSVVPAAAVAQNPATGQLTASLSSAASGALSWLEQNSIFSAAPNWMVVGGGLLLASMLMGGKKHR